MWFWGLGRWPAFPAPGIDDLPGVLAVRHWSRCVIRFNLKYSAALIANSGSCPALQQTRSAGKPRIDLRALQAHYGCLNMMSVSQCVKPSDSYSRMAAV